VNHFPREYKITKPGYFLENHRPAHWKLEAKGVVFGKGVIFR
jgi:hypothetical protein